MKMLLKNKIDRKFLIASDKIKQKNDKKLPSLHSKYVTFWSDRLIFVRDDIDRHGDFWTFTAFDLLMNESRQIKFRKTDKKFYNVYTYPSNELYGLILEQADNHFCLSFVFPDWDTGELIVIDKIEKQCTTAFILVDTMEPSNFVFEWVNYHAPRPHKYQSCKFVDGKIEFGEIHESNHQYHFYSNNKLIQVGSTFPPHIKNYNLATKKKLKTLATNSSLLAKKVIDWNFFNTELVNNRLYAYVHFEDTSNYGIIWADLKKKRFHLMNFKTNFEIWQANFLNENLIVFTRNEKQKDGIYDSEAKTYAIPIRRPNYLRQYAWICVVKVMKKRGEKDSYLSAKEYLPLNSDLRSYWFKDEEKMEIDKN